MRFVWDESKNRTNEKKHRIDLADVHLVFDGPMVTFLDTKKEYGEDRWIGIGWMDDLLVTVVFTERENDTIRLISARRASRHEAKIYETQIRH